MSPRFVAQRTRLDPRGGASMKAARMYPVTKIRKALVDYFEYMAAWHDAKARGNVDDERNARSAKWLKRRSGAYCRTQGRRPAVKPIGVNEACVRCGRWRHC